MLVHSASSAAIAARCFSFYINLVAETHVSGAVIIGQADRANDRIAEARSLQMLVCVVPCLKVTRKVANRVGIFSAEAAEHHKAFHPHLGGDVDQTLGTVAIHLVSDFGAGRVAGTGSEKQCITSLVNVILKIGQITVTKGDIGWQVSGVGDSRTKTTGE